MALWLVWSDAAAWARFCEATLALFAAVSEVEVETRAGRWLAAADAHEARLHLRAGAQTARLRLRDTPGVTLELREGQPVLVAGASLGRGGRAGPRRWLSADPDLPCPVPVLDLPWPEAELHPEFVRAVLRLAGAVAPLREHALTDREGVPLQLTDPDPPPLPGLDVLVAALRAHPTDLDALVPLLQPCCGALTLRPLGSDAAARFHLPPPPDTAVRLVPEPQQVAIEVDLSQGPEHAARALLHAAAHLHLGHLRPGDPAGHWDTPATLAHPSRRWDREVIRACPELVRTVPRRASLADCTPEEKALALLHRHIGGMAGSGRPLHPAAERYPVAAYQRQAAQRLVSQLDEYAGAMLCDGVGLGKTYVATTVIVHYVNLWREQRAQGDGGADPCRVTVLTPHSVVSTWRREALPPLTGHGVPAGCVRVLSHVALSRVLPVSEALEVGDHHLSDLEHLLLSDLVIVDEAHNFRSVMARRTAVLRDLLRTQPRREQRRRVLLLTATPVNNSLEDLRQQASLLFCKPLWLHTETDPSAYRGRARREVADRARRARGWVANEDVSPTLVFGDQARKFSTAVEFRDDIQFGVSVPHLGDYLKEQSKRLEHQRELTRLSMQSGAALPPDAPRIAAELLDRVVVQRSRDLCKEIERQQGSEVPLLFRPDAPPPQRLVYADEYDGIPDVLARFLPLFDAGDPKATTAPLSLQIYMWADVREGEREAGEVSSVVGLQRVLVLKRLESSPVAFLITLLRLLVLHAHRLSQLRELCQTVADHGRVRALDDDVSVIMHAASEQALRKIELLATGRPSTEPARDLLRRLSVAHKVLRPSTDPDEVPLAQAQMFLPDAAATEGRREQLDRLWPLVEPVLRDLRTLLEVVPDLTDIVFGRFDVADWPRRFIAGGEGVDWPESPAWGLRLINDPKLRRLIAAVLRARGDGQKVIVFSQFTDTLAYIGSVLRATETLSRAEWGMVSRELGHEAGARITESDLRGLIARFAVVSGATEDRDAVINSFAPFYRLGPTAPVHTEEAQAPLIDLWRQGWTAALRHPVDLLLATDVLAEGVNLQDASLLINYDVHWNPVRMIQRAGRVDRRLNPAIERATGFPDLEALCAELDAPAPRYWWSEHPGAAPVTVNLILPDALEAELQLRERIAAKTLAIDFTLGLDQGTGAEADWMASYRYRGVGALNAWQRDRAIEQIASYQERIRRLLEERGIDPSWMDRWNGWLRERGADASGPILASALLGQKGGEVAPYSRLLTPVLRDGVPWWLWTTAKPALSLLNFWIGLDGKTFPPPVRADLPWSEDQSRPLSAEDLLQVAIRLTEHPAAFDELPQVGRLVQQGATAISAGYLSTEHHRLNLKIGAVRLLQVRTLSQGDVPC